jgi:hypothetical protein
VDSYLARPDLKTIKAILDATYGIDPEFAVPPRAEWARRERHIWARRRG